MYVPEHFRLHEDDLRRVLREPGAGNLVTSHADGPDATLVPFWFDEPANQLVTHLVRNNPQATRPAAGPAMVVLDRHDAYVSPEWYATNTQLANVPTWDYVTVHVWGRMHVDGSPAAAFEAARALTLHYERPDSLDAVGEQRLARMARAIVAVRIDVERVEGKAKMSQNRHPDDIASLAAALEERGQGAMAAYLREVSLPHAQARFAMIDSLQTRRRA